MLSLKDEHAHQAVLPNSFAHHRGVQHKPAAQLVQPSPNPGLKPGQAWHLAGASFETSADVIMGGKKVEAGQYALSARKAKGGKWDLTLHEGRGFSRPGDDAIALDTTFDAKAPMYEHMSIDVQPAGDKENTRLNLEVRFDEMLASALIEIPKKN